MPFYPGPGLGGHCIPIDPFYLSWRAELLGLPTRFVELAGEINAAQPAAVVTALAEALSQQSRLALNGARVLVLGVAYKKNVNDIRESPGLEILDLLQARGADARYHDPFVPEIGKTRRHPNLAGMTSAPLDDLKAYDAALVIADHTDIDYRRIAETIPVVIDSRGTYRQWPELAEKITRA